MPSSYTPALRIELQATGENRTSWGARGNRSFERTEDGIAGSASVTMANQDYVLTTQYGAPDQARMVNVIVGGAMTANRNIFIPPSPKTYNFANNTSGGFDIIINNGIGSTLAIKNGSQMTVYSNGITIFTDNEISDFVNVANPIPRVVNWGYQRFRSGITTQWARLDLTGISSSYPDVPFPRPFKDTASVFSVYICGRNTALSGPAKAESYSLRHFSRTGVPGGTTGGNFTTRIYMMAIGITD